MDATKAMGKKLKELRKALGLTQAEFAKRANLTRSMVNNYEHGQNISAYALQAIKENLGIVKEYFCSDMSVQEILEFARMPLETTEDPYVMFAGLKNFAKNNKSHSFLLNTFAIHKLFNLDLPLNGAYFFVEMRGLEGAPILVDGDVIVVTKSEPSEGRHVIAKRGNNVFIAKYCITKNNGAMLRTLSENEIPVDESVEFLGVIEAAITTRIM